MGDPHGVRVFVVGATGYIGRHVVAELVDRGHDVVAFARHRSGVAGASDEAQTRSMLRGANVRFGDVTDPKSVQEDGFCGERFDAVISCLASRTGGVKDAWRIENDANRGVLTAALAAGVERFVLLSAICVQKPKLAFQFAKLSFRRSATGLWTHVVDRPPHRFLQIARGTGRVGSAGATVRDVRQRPDSEM